MTVRDPGGGVSLIQKFCDNCCAARRDVQIAARQGFQTEGSKARTLRSRCDGYKGMRGARLGVNWVSIDVCRSILRVMFLNWPPWDETLNLILFVNGKACDSSILADNFLPAIPEIRQSLLVAKSIKISLEIQAGCVGWSVRSFPLFKFSAVWTRGQNMYMSQSACTSFKGTWHLLLVTNQKPI